MTNSIQKAILAALPNKSCPKEMQRILLARVMLYKHFCKMALALIKCDVKESVTDATAEPCDACMQPIFSRVYVTEYSISGNVFLKLKLCEACHEQNKTKV